MTGARAEDHRSVPQLERRTWSYRPTGTDTAFSGIATSGTLYVAVGANGTTWSSTDKIAWTRRATGSAGQDLRAGTRYVAVGAAGTVLVSDDRRAWTRVASGDGRVRQALRFGAAGLHAPARPGVARRPSGLGARAGRAAAPREAAPAARHAA
jgi:hypothetical protein